MDKGGGGTGVASLRTRLRLREVEQYLKTRLQDIAQYLPAERKQSNSLLETIAGRLSDSGGKRIRPMLCILAAKLVDSESEPDDKLIRLAAAMELLHTATLLHDDVIDDATIRRGLPAAHVQFGNSLAILAGDHVLVRALDLVASVDNTAILQDMISTMGVLVQGELIQLQCRNMMCFRRRTYFQIVRMKTASLMSYSLRAGALYRNADAHTINILTRFGRTIGTVYQLIDDCLDYASQTPVLGKQVLSDVREGKLTYPLILAVERRPELVEAIRRVAAGGKSDEVDLTALEAIRSAVFETGAISDTMLLAEKWTDKATEILLHLPPSRYLDALREITRHLLQRLS
ncbi:polyprenyl synthetase family protein [bacterium]|nr:polyprenyl synthetase family protein [candidate division CSSED10-310 bacterium]